MRITIESTDRVVELISNGVSVPGRVWEGRTERGVPVIAVITRIAAHLEDDQAEFEHDLRETRSPSPAAIAAIPLRLTL